MKALDKIPTLIDKYQSDNQKLEKDLPVLKEVMGSVFKKEPELKELKLQLDSLSRQINLNLENKNKNQEQVTDMQKEVKTEAFVLTRQQEQPEMRSGQPMSIKDIVEANPSRIIIASPDTKSRQEAQPVKAKGFKL